MGLSVSLSRLGRWAAGQRLGRLLWLLWLSLQGGKGGLGQGWAQSFPFSLYLLLKTLLCARPELGLGNPAPENHVGHCGALVGNIWRYLGLL